MEVTYRLTAEDRLTFERTARARVARHFTPLLRSKVMQVLVFVAPFALTMLLPLYLWAKTGSGEIAVSVCVYGYFAGAESMRLCGRFWQRQHLRHLYSPDSYLLKEYRMKLDDEGIEVGNGEIASKYRWAAIKEISQEGKFLVLWVDRAYGLPVPARAFADDDEQQRLMAFAKAHIAAPT